MGGITAKGKVTAQAELKKSIPEFRILTDIVSADIPILLSRTTLRNMRASINSNSLHMHIGEQLVVQLSMGESGHIQLPILEHSLTLEPRTDERHTERIWASDEPSGEMSIDDIQKAHRHL